MHGDFYGRAGDKVKVYKEYAGGVVIVENVKGDRFSCRMEKLIEEPLPAETTEEKKAETKKVETKLIINQAPAAGKKYKAGATKQKTLF